MEQMHKLFVFVQPANANSRLQMKISII